MKIYRLFTTLLAIIVSACFFGVQGQFQDQYVVPSSGYPTASQGAAQNPALYSQFYRMTPGPALGNPIGAPQQFEVAGNTPIIVYLGEQMQSVPYSQYQFDPAFVGANSLWIKGATNWAQYAVVPEGATLSLLVISHTGGSGSLNFLDSDGQTYSHNYLFYPSSLLTFYAEKIGRHVLSFAINNQPSNIVVIDVVGAYKQFSNYPWYYPEYYPEYYYPNWGHKGRNIPDLNNRSPSWNHKGWNQYWYHKGWHIPGLDNKSPG